MSVTQIDGGRQIKAGTITNNEIASGAAIALSKLAEAVIQADGGQDFTADQSMGGFKLTNLADGTNPADAVSKSQLDAAVAAIVSDFRATVGNEYGRCPAPNIHRATRRIGKKAIALFRKRRP